MSGFAPNPVSVSPRARLMAYMAGIDEPDERSVREALDLFDTFTDVELGLTGAQAADLYDALYEISKRLQSSATIGAKAHQIATRSGLIREAA